MTTISRTYQSLLTDIARLYAETRASVVKMYWEIGKRIVEVEQGGDERAEYGRRLVERLSVDLTKRFGLGFSRRNLFRMKALYLQQKIVPPAAQLTWTHQAELLSLPDSRLRDRLAERAQRRDLSAKELRALVQRERARLTPERPANSQPASPPKLLTPKHGTIGVFQIQTFAGQRCVDLGFEAYRALTPAQAQRLADGDLVRRAVDGALHADAETSTTNLYTYAAQVLRVVDGDTLWTAIAVIPGEWRKEKLRLRGIDCPELGTAAGEAAKRYVQAQVAQATAVVVTTTKPDKWDRYLSDVYLTLDGAEVFLNNRLLELGHARRYDDVSPEDWEG